MTTYSGGGSAWIVCRHVANESAEVEIFHEESKTVVCHECNKRLQDISDLNLEEINYNRVMMEVMEEIFVSLCDEHMIESLKAKKNLQ